MPRPAPSQAALAKINKYVEAYRRKSGTSGHPEPDITEVVVTGLAANLDELGRPLCPCNFYADKQKEIEDNGRRWFCACDEMKKWKYCHCLLFVRPDGLPVTEYLPEDHEGRTIYGLVLDPTPLQGREAARSDNR